MCELTAEAYESDTHQPLVDRRAPKPPAVPRERWIVADRDGMCETLCRTLADAEATHKARQQDASTLGPWTITHYVEDVKR